MGRILIVVIAVFLVVSSCKKKNEEAPTEIVIDKTELKLVGVPNAEDSFKITTNRPWIIKVEPAADWLQLSAKMGEGDMVVKIKNTASAAQASSVTLTVLDVSERVAEKKIVINRMMLKTMGGSKTDHFEKGCATSDGGFIVVGHTNSYDGDLSFRTGTQNNFRDGLVVKYDKDGTVQWKKAFGGNQKDELNFLFEIPGGGYMLVGSSESTDGDFSSNHGGSDLWIMKINVNGEKVWSKLMGGSAYEYGYAIIPDANGSFLVGGSASSSNGDLAGTGNRSYKDAWVIKLTAEGNILWHKLYGNDRMDIFRTITKDIDGYVLGGNQGITSSAITCYKIDASGTLQWEKIYISLSGGYASLNDLVINSDKGMLAFGHGNNYGAPFPTSLGGTDGLILHHNAAGVFQWARYIGGSGIDFLNAQSGVPGKGFLLAGSSESNDGHVKENKGKMDAWFLLTNEQGEVNWSKTIGGSAEDEFRQVISLPNKKIVLIGNTKSNDHDITGNHGDQDGFILVFE